MTTNIADPLADATAVAKQLDDLRAKNAKLADQLAEMSARQAQARLRDTTLDALAKSGCQRTDVAYLALRDDLRISEDGGVISAVGYVDGEPRDLDLTTFIDKVAKVRLAEFWQPRRGSVAPAAGQSYDFTREQIQDSEFYAANADKIRESLERGRVKM